MASASCKRYHLISPGFTPTGLLLQFTMYTISRAAFCSSRLYYELHLHSIAMSCTKSPSHNSVVPVANTVVVAATTVPTSASSASIAIAEGSAIAEAPAPIPRPTTGVSSIAQEQHPWHAFAGAYKSPGCPIKQHCRMLES
ncbi:unnamed protein product [Sphagnum jensenii]|uniref:Uncharacterized protein n=1 Tax=Sphagnum jensenii TaxID=128206 RepID=A0ABP1BEP9_9BRYO